MWGCCRRAARWISRRKRSGPSVAAELGVEHLERDGPVVLQIVREIHRRHAATSELPLEAVAVGEGVREWGRDAVRVRWHRNNIEEGR